MKIKSGTILFLIKDFKGMYLILCTQEFITSSLLVKSENIVLLVMNVFFIGVNMFNNITKSTLT